MGRQERWFWPNNVMVFIRSEAKNRLCATTKYGKRKFWAIRIPNKVAHFLRSSEFHLIWRYWFDTLFTCSAFFPRLLSEQVLYNNGFIFQCHTLSVTNNVMCVCVCACCLNECVRICNSFWYFSFRSLAISPPRIRQYSFKTFANNMNCCVFERSEMLVNYMASSCLRVSILLPLIALTRKRFGNYLYHIK